MVSRFDLVVVGDANPDVVLAGAPRDLPFGQHEQLVDAGSLVLGGSGAIAACGAARLGLRTAFIGRVGDDEAGRFVLDQLTSRGVDVTGCVIDPHIATAMTVVLVRGEDRSILTALGCLPFFDLGDVDMDLVLAARHAHISSYYLQPRLAAGLPRWLATVRAEGVTTSLDTNDDPSGRWDPAVRDAIAQTDVVLPNEAEALALSGVAGDVTEASRALAELSRLVVVKRGAEGALAWTVDGPVVVPGLAVCPVDTIGAGDSFDAGLIAGLLAGHDVVDALRLAVACGSLSTRAPGGTAGQATLAEATAALGLVVAR